MRTAPDTPDNDDLRRIADALERIADHLTPAVNPAGINVTLTGDYAGTKSQLAAYIARTIREEIRKGTIPPNWNAA